MTLHHWLWHSWFSRKWGLLWSNSTIWLSWQTNLSSRSHLTWLWSQSRFLLLKCSLNLSCRSWFFSILHGLFTLQLFTSFFSCITISKIMMETIIKIRFLSCSWLKLLGHFLSLLLLVHLIRHILPILCWWHRGLILWLLR